MRLTPVARQWRLVGDQALARLGLSSSTGWCLIYLDRMGDDVRQADLARAVEISDATLVRTLHQLEASGLIARHPDIEDKRVNRIRLTEAGRTMIGPIEAQLADIRQALLAGVSDADISAALRVCEALGEGLAARRGGVP